MGDDNSKLQGRGPKSGPKTAMGTTQRRNSGLRSSTDGQKRSNLTTLPSVGDPPQLEHKDDGTDLCHSDPKHAISDTLNQPQSESAGALLTRSKAAPQGRDKQPRINSTSKVTAGIRRKVPTVSHEGDGPFTIQSRTSNRRTSSKTMADDKSTRIQDMTVRSGGTKTQRLKLTLPRVPKRQPQRSNRKRYTLKLRTEVDWDEDLRPTDGETPWNSHERGTSVSTPCPELSSVEESSVKTNHKRKGSKAGPPSGKRRKAVKAKSSTGKKNIQLSQLPLTLVDAVPSVPPHPKQSPINLRSNSQTVNHEFANTNNMSAVLQSASALPKPKEAASRERVVIEISSDPLISTSSSPDTSMDVLRNEAYRYRVTRTTSDGRGKAVGQKLADALRGVELHTQLRPAVETSLQSTHKGRDSTIHDEEPTITSPQIHICDNPQIENLQADHHTLQHKQETFERVSEAPKVTQNVEIPRNVTNPHILDAKMEQNPPKLQEKPLSRQSSTHMDFHKDSTNPGGGEQRAGSKEPLKKIDQLEDSQINSESLHHPINNTFAHYLELEIDAANGGLSNEQYRNHETPESQRPLLSPHTPFQFIFYPPPRDSIASIVDSNGSPRLMPGTSLLVERARARLDHVKMPSDVSIASSSIKERNSDGSSYYSSDDGQVWSKYQRDMFLEYGFETESMKKKAQAICSKEIADQDASKTLDLGVGARNPSEVLSTLFSGISDNPIITGPDLRGIDAGIISTQAPNLPHKNAEESILHNVSQTATRAPLQISEPQQSSVPGETNPQDWIIALQNAQRSAHEVVLQTNERLSSQLAIEQDTIHQVLQIYQQGCNRILDELFQAQQVRMGLYQQQMTTVKEQHRQLCQNFIRGFQELDHRVQDGS
ncbi:uncharacterized protein N7483_009749 [Penicillium malachiteum]|uniref:uncharacterized protein n=1 Tax=Penicillium malachiteum TaxID=1324776 RepID=UPI00254922D6|nr:uncharacterized protein N7483_009749 [Penicillium malachiteum]KAJ5721815.1 hypothetical protein N7483_009749 [Penicillium malachiteum]